MRPERVDVVIVGGGQAGLATSYELTARGVEHVVLERGRIGQTWRGRWDSFCLVTPNHTLNLPGDRYEGDEPDGFLPRDAFVERLESYARSFGAPLREGVIVRSVRPADNGLEVRTMDGTLLARDVVIASGSFRATHRPEAATLPAGLEQLHTEEYRSPGALRDGPVLVIGGGQSGAQIAEELAADGREVFLSTGRAPWMPRRLEGRDIFWWIIEGGFMEQPVEALPSPMARLGSNPLTTGRDGGHDLNLATLRERGVTLLGRFLGAEATVARFAPDLHVSVGWSNDRLLEIGQIVADGAARHGLPKPEMPGPLVLDGPSPESLDLARFGAVIHAAGYRPDYATWVDVPGAFDELGFPLHRDGRSTATAGLYFVGTHFLRKRKSGILWGVGEDAALVADAIAGA